MSKNTRISHSQVNMYSTCARKYKFHYIDRLRSKYLSGALLFGGALDIALNDLLKNKDTDPKLYNIEDTIRKFDKSMRYNFINDQGYYIPECTLVVYADKDFDAELLLEEDLEKYKQLEQKLGLYEHKDITVAYNHIKDQKKLKGWVNLSEDDKKLYNMANYLSMRRKGHIMIRDYEKKILPKIKDVLAVQKHLKLKNTSGDEVVMILDLIAELHNGKRYLLDNKTSSIRYTQDMVERSQQLIGYFHAAKEEYKLDGIGFIPMYKQIHKNRIKICSQCGKDGSGGRFKKCDAETDNGRCNGEWTETISPECEIEILLNDNITAHAESLVLDTFDEANEGIKNQQFNPNLSACSSPFPCPYMNKCWKGDSSELVQLAERKR